MPSANSTSLVLSSFAPSNFDHFLGELMGYLLLAMAISAVAAGIYFYMKSNSQCPKCHSDWSWKKVSSIDEPRTTFQTRASTGQANSNGRLPTYVQTFESGLRTTDYQCAKCGYEERKQGSYKKLISSNTEY